MAFGFDDPALEDMRRRAATNSQQPALQSPPQLRPLVGPGGMMWPTFQSPFADEPAPERQPAPWEYGPAAPNIQAPPRNPNAPPPMGFEPIPTNDPSLDADIRDNILPQIPSIEARYAPQMPGVQSGASSTAGPSVGLPPPPQPSGLRVKLQGGDWQEADPDGRLPMPPQERSSTAYDPVDRRTEAVSAPSGGGTFSMMTAPENVDAVTRGSQLEDAQFESQIRELEDPYAQQRASARFQGDEQIRVEEAKDRIAMRKQSQVSQEMQGIQLESDQGEMALAQKYGVPPEDVSGASIPDEARRMQYQQEREALMQRVQQQYLLLLSRYGMAPKNSAGVEALSGI